jgi:hypothetical protein
MRALAPVVAFCAHRESFSRLFRHPGKTRSRSRLQALPFACRISSICRSFSQTSSLMVKHFVLPNDPIIHPRTLRPPPVSRRCLAPRLPGASHLAGPFRAALIRRSQRTRASPHRRWLATIPRWWHRRRSFSRSTRLAARRNLPRRRLRYPALPAAFPRHRRAFSRLAPALAHCRILASTGAGCRAFHFWPVEWLSALRSGTLPAVSAETPADSSLSLSTAFRHP